MDQENVKSKRLADIDFIEAKFLDLSGRLKSRLFPGERLGELIRNGFGFDGSSIKGLVEIQSSDMIAMPDITSIKILPRDVFDWNVAIMVCDIVNNGKLFEGSSRYVLKKVLEELKDQGMICYVGVEPEFYILKEEFLVDQGGYMDSSPIDEMEDFKKEFIRLLGSMGFEIEVAHHEVGPSQHEITFKFDDILATADKVVIYRYIAKEFARRKGFNITFMPKPFYGKAGNGMHVHMSLFSDGKNLFYDPHSKDCVSDVCKQFIAGILKFSKEIALVVSPTVNSYKRLVPGYEAPIYTCWGFGNRSALIRIPNYRITPESLRIEFRCPDPSCDPYLAFAVILKAGLEGIKKKLKPPLPVDKNVYELGEEERKKLRIDTLPRSLEEAIRLAKNSVILGDTLGKETLAKFIDLKLKEWREYCKEVEKENKDKKTVEVTEWEIKKYLFL